MKYMGKCFFVILYVTLLLTVSNNPVFAFAGGEANSSIPVVAQSESGLKIVTGHPDLKMEVKRCEVSGTTCVLDLVIINYAADAKIYFYGGNKGTKIYDDEGNIYTGGSVEIQPAGATYSTSYGYNPSDFVYPTEVPVKFRITIKGVSNAATEFKRVNLKAHSYIHSIEENPIMLYNVPISREGDE